MNKNKKIKNIYNMLRDFYYEKNGLDLTIEFLEYILQELKKLQKGDK